MLTEKELKAQLKLLAQEKFQPSDEDAASALIPAMLKYIGSTDAELRDDLIYVAFATWVMEYNVVKSPELQKIFKGLLSDKHLFFRIGEEGTDSIFQRSFSALWLPPILINHRKEAFLSEGEIKEGLEKLILFLDKEKDRRGFVDGKGWAHAIAHAADALDDFALCSEFGEVELENILRAIQKTISISDYIYAHGEDERMVTPVLAIINRQLIIEEQAIEWIKSFDVSVKETKSMPESIIVRSNIKNFLQSLYFRLKWNKISAELFLAIEKTLHEISLFT